VLAAYGFDDAPPPETNVILGIVVA
jgi:hypothetical protein